MCAEFNWFLNKQGLRGLTGKKGDQGFSPIVDVVEDTIESYKLKITTENNEIETPNLKGSLSIQDQGGTYVRYDRESGELTANEADRATKESYGIVRLAKTEDLDNLELQDTVAITPETLREGLVANLISPDNSIQIVLNLDTQKTELRAVTGGIESEIAQERAERIAADSSIAQSVSTLSTNLQRTDNKVVDIKLELSDEIKTRMSADIDLDVKIDDEANYRMQNDLFLQEQIDAERQERETQDTALQSQLGTKLTADNIKQGENITITRDGNNVTINSTGGGVVPENIMTVDTNQTVSGRKVFQGDTLRISTGNDYSIPLVEYHNERYYTSPDRSSYFTGALEFGENVTGNIFKEKLVIDEHYNLFKYAYPLLSTDDVDNQTIKVVDGKLHADFSEIGDEVNTLAGRMSTAESNITTLQGEMTDVTGNVEELQDKVKDLELFKFPNVTIIGEPTINNGQISNFSINNYLQFPFEFETKGRTWVLKGSFDTRADVITQQNIIDSLASVALAVRNARLVLALSSNGTTFDLGEHTSDEDFDVYVYPNTKYYFRLRFNGYSYDLAISTDKQKWTPAISVLSDKPIASTVMTISSAGHPFGGIINLNDWDLTVASLLVWQGMDDVGIASRMDVNASNITETGINHLKEVLGLANIETLLNEILGNEEAISSLVDEINVAYSTESNPTASVMMLSLEPTELDVENSFTSNKTKAVFSEDLILPKNSVESYEDDDTDLDLGGNA